MSSALRHRMLRLRVCGYVVLRGLANAQAEPPKVWSAPEAGLLTADVSLML